MKSIPTSQKPSHVTRPALHEHAWQSESTHRTSIGDVVYVRCVACGARRVDVRERTFVPPIALSQVVGPT